MKKCPKCGLEKPLSEFYPKTKTKDKHSGYCKACSHLSVYEWRIKNPARHRALCKKSNAKHPDTTLARHLRKKYGMCLAQYDELILRSGGICEICGREEKLSVDHIHGTNPTQIRGIVCTNCNLGLGSFFDSVLNLKAAIALLQRPVTLAHQ